MAKVNKKKVSKIKTKKKIWFKILAPKLFGTKELGETYLQAVDAGIGKTVKVNLRNVTGSVRDQNSQVSFQVIKADGSTLHTRTIGYELTTSYVKRAVRKNTNRLDDYFVLQTKTGHDVILKSLMITLGKTQRSTRSALRRELEAFLKEEIGKLDFEAVVGALVSKKIQIAAKKKLQKTHPLKEVSVRVLKLKDKSKGKIVVEEAPAKEEAPAEEKAEEEQPAEE